MLSRSDEVTTTTRHAGLGANAMADWLTLDDAR
jgi:hypothetical protein